MQHLSLTQTPCHKQAGYTLIELILTIILLGAIAGMLLPFFTAAIHSPDPVIRERAIHLGQAMMDEILNKRWDENTPVGGGPICTNESSLQGPRPSLLYSTCGGMVAAEWSAQTAGFGPEGTEVRTTFDDVDDYHGINMSNDFTDQNGNAFTLTGYQRQVNIRYILSDTAVINVGTDNAGGTRTDTKLIEVIVTSPLGETFNFVAVACNI